MILNKNCCFLFNYVNLTRRREASRPLHPGLHSLKTQIIFRRVESPETTIKIIEFVLERQEDV